MKKYYNVSFQYSESVFCANIAHAESAEKAKAHYTEKGYKVIGDIKECTAYEIEESRRRGKPIIEID